MNDEKISMEDVPQQNVEPVRDVRSLSAELNTLDEPISTTIVILFITLATRS